MKASPIVIILLVTSLLIGCTQPETISITPDATSSLTPVPTPTPECHEAGTLVHDRVFFANIGDYHDISVYLPPCYAEHPTATYPILYWTNGDFWWRQLFDTTDRLIDRGNAPAFIEVMIQIYPTKGYGADTQIISNVVPYIDSHYRTQPDRLHWSITGFSNGAAIAIRAAFQAPSMFSRVAVLSGGIANGEQEKFMDWIAAMLTDQRPEVMMDVGDQDNIIVLTTYLTDLLDSLNYPYTFVHSPGDHGSEYTDDHLENILKWLMAGRQ